MEDGWSYIIPRFFMLLIAHIDMNSYFASVEQQANAHWRNRPVGVCAYLHPRGCVIAASIEAKRLGVRVGMTMAEARAHAPETVFVQNDPAKYRSTTSRIFRILSEVSDRIEHYSIDEAFVDLSGWCRDEAEAAFLFSRVKRRIREEVGEWLRCSVGIASTRFLAKFASDQQKPDGLVVIVPKYLDAWLARADLEDACGIGQRMRRRLERLGIHTLLELKHQPVGTLMRAFGVYGYALWCHVNGIVYEEIVANNAHGVVASPKSVGHSYCVPRRVHREGKIEAVLLKLTDRAGARLRLYERLAHDLMIVVGFREKNHPSQTMHHHFGEPTDDALLLARTASALLHHIWHDEVVDFLAVTLTDLQPRSSQLGWIADAASKRVSLTYAMDAIRARYGTSAIHPGSCFVLKDSEEAPDRIGYRKIM